MLVSGELGAGKTTFVRGALRALGVTEPVTSPTFVVGHLYEAPGVAHLDLYRLAGLGDEDPGLLDPYFGPDLVTFVEWPERAGSRRCWASGAVAGTCALAHAGVDRRRLGRDRARARHRDDRDGRGRAAGRTARGVEVRDDPAPGVRPAHAAGCSRRRRRRSAAAGVGWGRGRRGSRSGSARAASRACGSGSRRRGRWRRRAGCRSSASAALEALARGRPAAPLVLAAARRPARRGLRRRLRRGGGARAARPAALAPDALAERVVGLPAARWPSATGRYDSGTQLEAAGAAVPPDADRASIA